MKKIFLLGTVIVWLLGIGNMNCYNSASSEHYELKQNVSYMFDPGTH
ncbi:hypothetical protein P4278_23815 [Bacillus thuringiensis]|nr:hypothetical protein [Bacillus thuringiensis]MED2755533.1 hypothetical protein [Bacillus thuringiensis]MED2769786.1 hypothetical protein [Bacillus thuringiensis]MED2773431.1 hypothetical protein [Bacillus thuringiensis]MED2782715.1 hypothetical protein [Bacillus thuringiensis]